MASRRSRERANSRPWEQERNAWNCPHCAPKICSCEWRHSEPAQDDTERCPNTGDLFEDNQDAMQRHPGQASA